MQSSEPKAEGAFDDIRAAVGGLCQQFPGEYRREVDRERRYPSDFVEAVI